MRRRRRSVDSVMGAFTAMCPDRRPSDSSPGLTAASPATTALTRVPRVCANVCVSVCAHMCVCVFDVLTTEQGPTPLLLCSCLLFALSVWFLQFRTSAEPFDFSSPLSQTVLGWTEIILSSVFLLFFFK